MKKPEYQWETNFYFAQRQEISLPEWCGEQMQSDSKLRLEAFVLEGKRPGIPLAHAVFSLTRQIVDAQALDLDPQLIDAVRAWLIARGGRSIHLFTSQEKAVLAEEITPRILSDASPAPRRLITLCPSNAEMVAFLACFDRVIACEDSSDWPAQTKQLERLGPDLAPNLDRIHQLNPDLVISSLSVPGMERVVTGLRARGIPQVVCAPRSFQNVLAEIHLLGSLLGKTEKADEVAQQLAEQKQQLLQTRPASPRRVYLEWWPRPMFTPGRDCYSNELIDLAGGVNVFGTRPGSSLEVQVADLVEADPEICFVSWCGVKERKLDPKRVLTRPGLEQVSAIRYRRVFALDEQFSGRPGPRMLTAAQRMAAVIAQVNADLL